MSENERDDEGGRDPNEAVPAVPAEEPSVEESAVAEEPAVADDEGELEREFELPPPIVNESEDYESLRLSQAPRLTLGFFEREALSPLFFGLLFVSSVLALGYLLAGFLTDLVLGFILVGFSRRLYGKVRARLGNPWVASGFTTVALGVSIIGPILGLAYSIVREAFTSFEWMSSWMMTDSRASVSRIVDNAHAIGVPLSEERILRYLSQFVAMLEGALVDVGGSIVTTVVAVGIHVSIILVIVFYLLVDGEKFKKYLFELSPLPDDEDARLVDTFKKVSRGVIVGNGIGSAIQGILGGIAMWSVGLPAPLLWGAVMALFAFLPLIGISIVAWPAGLLLLLSGRVPEGVGFLVFCSLVSLVVENVVKTKVMGSAMRMHDLLVFLSILGGLSVFGVIGLIYGPLIAMTFMTLSDLYFERYRPALAKRFLGRTT